MSAPLTRRVSEVIDPVQPLGDLEQRLLGVGVVVVLREGGGGWVVDNRG